ncbi:alpha/beta hydrolase [Corynebacterium hansenii]|uniref:Alpha/beta hydrolase n=1 Tax=Corynebacterium hansenii TaxID=394964 RepID=A0ABV7ZQX7_9CORY|nr:alpha/beta hydrolase [Corynebacterium hansenii]WJZ01165.1 hypothetical protein CHAN_12905 [Corynebacterium hansenii]
MPDIGMILAWKPETFGPAIGMWRGAGKRLADAAEKVAGSVAAVPEGDLAGVIRVRGAAAAEERGGRLRRDAASIGRFADELDKARKSLTSARDWLAKAVADAEGDGFRVDRATGRVSPKGSGAKSVAGAQGPGKSLSHHRKNVGYRFRRALDADATAANRLRGQLPAGRHMTTPGMPLGRTEGLEGLSPAQAAEVERVRGQSGYGAGADVEVLATDPGTTAVALGDPRTAEHVITIVPGTGSTAEELAGQIDRARLFAGPDVAVIAWTYDAPPGLVNAASAEYHERAATSLQSFQAQLADNPNMKMTVMGHSYGATVVTQAAKGAGLHADAVVLAGSPGAGPDVHGTRDMRLNKRDGTPHEVSENKRRVIAVTSPDDIIRTVGASVVHGANVVGKAFGANRMDISDIAKGKRIPGVPRWWFPRRYLDAHTDDYFPDPIFREKVESTIARIPGSGPGAGVEPRKIVDLR